MSVLTNHVNGHPGSSRRKALALALAAAAGTGGLALGLSEAAGATSSSASLANKTTSVNKGFDEVLKQFNCSTAQQRLNAAARIDAQFNKRYALFQSKLTAAQKAGKTKRVNFYTKRLAAAHKEQGRLENSHFRARQARVAKLAQQKCHISPPAST